MTIARTALLLVGLLGLVGQGCAEKKESMAPRASVLEVGGDARTAGLTPSPAGADAPIVVPPAPYSPPLVTAEPAPLPDDSAATAAEPGPTVYTVQKGDSLMKIARAHYGDASKWKQIAAANPGINPNLIRPGQKLTLP